MLRQESLHGVVFLAVKRLLLHVVVAILVAAPAGASPAEWKIEVTTSGGLTGGGAGDLTLASDGALTLIGPARRCTYRMSARELQAIDRLIAKSTPRDWRRAYIDQRNPSGCCDMIRTTLTLSLGGGTFTTHWFSVHPPLAADLESIERALFGADPPGVTSRYSSQCSPSP
jgi:hypothetical protein